MKFLLCFNKIININKKMMEESTKSILAGNSKLDSLDAFMTAVPG